MEIIYTKAELATYIEKSKTKNKTIGFVPTMGALHQGHLSLVKQASIHTDIVIASIFVNPTQFNNSTDLKNYPSTIDQDLELLLENSCHAVFIPSVSEMYGDENYTPYKIDLGTLGEVLEGKERPGHFDGVVEVLHILFSLVQPDQAFFGLKDYQQVKVVEKLVEHMQAPIEIVKCETIREADGLAMSSRNKRLSSEERKIASNLYKALSELKEHAQKEPIPVLKKSYIDKLNALKNIQVEYLDIVDYQELTSLNTWNEKGRNLGVLAAYIGEIRLIDNLLF